MSELTVALRLLLDGRNLDRNLDASGRNVGRFSANAKRQIESIRRAWDSASGTVAKLGLGVGGLAALRQSARLDQSLTQIKQTAGGTRAEVEGLRVALFDMTRESGRELAGLRGGFNALIQSGLNWRQALSTIRAINPASVVTGANEETLAGGLTVAAAAYKFDLSQPGMAARLLDQMTVAGRLGNAELEDLASIFARVGVNAKSANLQFSQTLGFIEGLSMVERNPERLATLADSTLRLFGNQKYKQAASKATGVGFYNTDGSNRDPFAVLSDIATAFQKLSTDKARNDFVAKAFGETDLDTQKGIKTLLGSGSLDQVRAYALLIDRAGGTLKRDLGEAMDNAVNQAGRVKAILSSAADTLARPLNRAFAEGFGQLVKPTSEGGLGASNAQLLAGATTLVVGGTLLKSVATQLLNKVPLIGGALGNTASTAVGLTQGAALRQATGVTDVFVVNWGDSASGGGGAGAAAGGAAGAAAAAAAAAAFKVPGMVRASLALRTAGPLAVAGSLGYGVGRGYDRFVLTDKDRDDIGRQLTKVLSVFSAEARTALAVNAEGERIRREELSIALSLDENFNARLRVLTKARVPDYIEVKTLTQSGPLSQVPFR